MEPGTARSRIHLNRRRIDRNRPEQTRRFDTRLEIMYLFTQPTPGGPEQINSDEAERTLTLSTVGTDKQALHEPHVSVEIERSSVRGALRISSANDPAEVCDRRHLEPDHRREHMNERITRHRIEAQIEAAWNRSRIRNRSERRSHIKQARPRERANRNRATTQELPPRHTGPNGTLDKAPIIARVRTLRPETHQQLPSYGLARSNHRAKENTSPKANQHKSNQAPGVGSSVPGRWSFIAGRL